MPTEEVGMTYTQAAVERAVKAHEVLMQALSGRQPWIHVAEVLGVSARTVRRLRGRYEQYGFTGLYDHRQRMPSPRAVPVAEVQRLLALYRDRYGPRDGHPGVNVRHLSQVARRERGGAVSYSFVKKALQAAGLVRKRRPRGRHRRRREPRPGWGELLHLDGRRHRWLALVPDSWQTLLVVVDDATKRLLYAQLVDDEAGEGNEGGMTALWEGLETHGTPGALYTDRASWAVYTPTSGTAPERSKLTQVGRALATLGIEHIVGFSPQARGRSERANGTPQGRLVNELPRGARAERAGQRHRAGPPRKRAPGGRHPHGGRGQPLSARPLHPRLQRQLRSRPRRSHECLRPGRPPRPPSDPVSRRGARRGARQHRAPRGRTLANRQPARPPQLREPARARAPASHWPAFCVVGAAGSRPLHQRRPAPAPSFWEYRHSGPLRDRASWGKYARVPSTLPHESGPSSAPRLGLSGQITCQTRAVRSLVNDRPRGLC